MRIFLRKVSITLDLIFLNKITKHKYIFYIILLNHPPKIIEAIRKGTLSSNNFFTLNIYKICIYVVFYLFFFIFSTEDSSRRIKSHKTSISIIRELLWIFVEFVNVMLCLCHKTKQFKFGW